MKILKFTSDTCAPCKMMAPIVKKIAESNQIELETIDIGKTPRRAAEYNVRSLPTMVFLNNGKYQGQLVGFQAKQQILNMINEIRAGV